MPPNQGTTYIEIRAKLDQLERDLKKAEGLSETAGQRSGEKMQRGMGQKLQGLGSTLTRTLTPAAAVMGAFALKAFNEVDSGLDAIRSSTGATGEKLEQLGESMKRVGGQVTQPLSEVGQVMGEVQKRTDLMGTDLEELTVSLLNLNGRLNNQASVENVTRVFGDWSVATEHQTETLDLLFRASQATGPSIDALSDKLVQFGAPLRQMGFDLDESAALLGKFEKEGVNTNLVMGSMRIALGKLARDGVSDIPKAFEDLVEQIENAGSAGEANALALETFGARAGPDMAAAIREGRFEIGELFKQVRDGKETVETAAEDTEDYSDTLKMLLNRAMAVVGPVGEVAFAISGVGMAIGPAIKGIGKLTTKYQEAAKASGTTAVATGGLADGIGKAATRLSAFALTPVGLATLALGGLATAFFSSRAAAERHKEEIRANAQALLDGEKTVEDYTSQIAGLERELATVREGGGNPFTAFGTQQELETAQDTLDTALDKLSRARDELEELPGGLDRSREAMLDMLITQGDYADAWALIDRWQSRAVSTNLDQLEKQAKSLSRTADDLRAFHDISDVEGLDKDLDKAENRIRRFAGMTRKEFQDWSDSTQESLGDISGAFGDLADDAHVSADEILKAYRDQIAAAAEFKENLNILISRGAKPALIKDILEMGDAGPLFAKGLAEGTVAATKEFFKLRADAKDMEEGVTNSLKRAAENSKREGGRIGDSVKGIGDSAKGAQDKVKSLADALMAFHSIDNVGVEFEVSGTGVSGGSLAATPTGMAERLMAVVPGAQVISSGYRPFDTGSFHAVPPPMNAVDIAGSNLGSVYELAKRTFGANIREMIYAHKIYQHGSEGYYAPDDHFDHVHLADQGGHFRGPGVVAMGRMDEYMVPAKKVGPLPAGLSGPVQITGRLRLVNGEAYIDGVATQADERGRRRDARFDRLSPQPT